MSQWLRLRALLLLFGAGKTAVARAVLQRDGLPKTFPADAVDAYLGAATQR